MCFIVFLTAAHHTQGILHLGLKGWWIGEHFSCLPLRSALLKFEHTYQSPSTLSQCRFIQRSGERLSTCISPELPGAPLLLVWGLSSELQDACLLPSRQTASPIALYTKVEDWFPPLLSRQISLKAFKQCWCQDPPEINGVKQFLQGGPELGTFSCFPWGDYVREQWVHIRCFLLSGCCGVPQAEPAAQRVSPCLHKQSDTSPPHPIYSGIHVKPWPCSGCIWPF